MWWLFTKALHSLCITVDEWYYHNCYDKNFMVKEIKRVLKVFKEQISILFYNY